ncbi:uncharacterized protein LOC114526663 [Dendronephthya gigantea]|uniref:uncharacterized protein LOC114526663 n=1 Tax=Dendronephthya gigantea TaxID=151771 RepID=UPI00106A0E0F|nr:uncharacterized protein LOC114526663 [Dendronephthya gigantea]
MVQALRQIANTPKLEYLRFDEQDNSDESRKLQLLIQHCSGKAREAIESYVSLSNGDGYRVAKDTLYENFGKPHVIVETHIKRLMNLPSLKIGDGPSLLQFARHLETAQKTLTGMGSVYVADLDHMHILRELVKKLPMYLSAKWTELAGNLFESEQRPRFEHFLKFVKEKAKLVNNEFGKDMSITTYSKPKLSSKDLAGNIGKSDLKYTSFAASGMEDSVRQISPNRKSTCEVCSGQHRIWNCDRFKKAEYKLKRKIVLQNGFCNKCLGKGHIAKTCPKTRFKCQEVGCDEPHHTLMHRPNNGKDPPLQKQVKTMKSSQTQTGAGDRQETPD